MSSSVVYKKSPQKTEGKVSSGIFSIFRNKNYALYFGGQFISLVGTWMQMVALSWFTYTLTNSPFLLAIVGASSQLPSLVVMPFAGVFADRLDRKKVIVIVQCLAMFEASLLAFLTLTNQVQVWHLIALGVFAGVISAFDMPTRSAFVFDLVDNKEDLPAAIAMNSTLMNGTRLIGPALAGFIVASVGTGMCFLINALSYIAVIWALLLIKNKSSDAIENGKNASLKSAKDTQRDAKDNLNDASLSAGKERSIISELKVGFDYVAKTRAVRQLIVHLGVFGIGGMAYAMLLPVFVREIHGDSNTLGYLMSGSAVGSLCATLLLASRKSVVGLSRWITVSSFAFSFFLIAFSFVNSFWPAIFVLAAIGACMMLQMASINTILQTIVEEDKRGRVMSLFTMAFMGAAPIGSLGAGALANKIGLSHTLLLCGIYCLCVSIVFYRALPKWRKETRPIYIEKGLLIAEEEAEILAR
ncbi:MAG: MFS transporter [Candidatus Melainabacteria bacterium]|nr:MAG: MFS transporter [Candidatus Melainabacteria bacterium]